MTRIGEGSKVRDDDTEADCLDRATENVTPLPLGLMALEEIDPSEIEPRPWLYGTILQRKYVSLLVAPGGTGKSQLALAISVDLASNKRILGPHIFEPVPVWFLSLEDDTTEIQRRVAAIRLVHKLQWADLRGRLYAHDGRKRRVCMAKSTDGGKVIFPDQDEVKRLVRAGKIGLIVVDPFIRSHELDENNNPAMDAAVRAWTEIAEEANCAVLLVHHVRKSPADGMEAARGAKALVDAARVGLLLTAMTEQEAEDIGVKPEDAHRFIRMDNAKANMAPANAATWFHMVERNLGNSRPMYPSGDTVSAIVPWNRPKAFEGISDLQCNDALTAINVGPRPGIRYCAHQRGRDNSRWAGSVLITQLGISEARASTIIGLWLKTGLLFERAYRDAEQRKDRTGVFVDDTKRPDNAGRGGAPIA
jgi:hypothetical protein